LREKYHAELIEKIVEQDDTLMTEYLDGKIPTTEILKLTLIKTSLPSRLKTLSGKTSI
jgi:translation elongation factor EF-G